MLCSFRFVCWSTDLSEYHLCPKFASEWLKPYMVRKGNRNCRSFLHPHLTTMSIFSIRKKDDGVFSRTDITDEPFLVCASSIVLKAPPPPSSFSERLQSRRFVSSIFRNVCRVGVFSQGCLSTHINAWAFADTESSSERGQDLSGMTLHTLQSWSISSLCTESHAAEQLFKL